MTLPIENKIPEILRVTGLPADVGNVIGACLPPAESGGVDEAVKAIWRERLESMERQPESFILRRHLAVHPKKPAEAYKAAIEELSENPHTVFKDLLEGMSFRDLRDIDGFNDRKRDENLVRFFETSGESFSFIKTKLEEIHFKLYGFSYYVNRRYGPVAKEIREWLNEEPNPVEAITDLSDVLNAPPEIVKFTSLDLPDLARFLKKAAEEGHQDTTTAILTCSRGRELSPDQLGEAFSAAAISKHPYGMKPFFASPRFREIPPNYLEDALIYTAELLFSRPMAIKLLLSQQLPKEAFTNKVIGRICSSRATLLIPFMKQEGFRMVLKQRAPWLIAAAVAYVAATYFTKGFYGVSK